MIVWIEKALAIAIRERLVAEHGGATGQRDDRLLDSALASPAQLAAYGEPRPDLADLAASLAFGIARNHPFVEGNKRTAAACCEVFIELNGAALEASDLELFPLYLALAEGKLTERDFAAWIRSRIPGTDRNSLHERRTSCRTGRRSRRLSRTATSTPQKTSRHGKNALPSSSRK
jgi:death-on-curing protein